MALDIDALAKDIQSKIFDRVESDRCLHASSIADEISGALRKALQPSLYLANLGALTFNVASAEMLHDLRMHTLDGNSASTTLVTSYDVANRRTPEGH